MPPTHLEPYPAYKDSGVPWLGNVPAHWNLSHGRAAFREKKVKNTGMIERQVLSLSYGRIVVKPPEKLHGLVPESFETYQVVDPNDIIVRSTDLQNDWNSLRIGLVKDRGIITSAYICLNVNGSLTPEYAHLLLHSYDLMKIYYGMGSGLRQNLDITDFKYLPIPVPPPAEQHAIAHFLDHFDRRVNRFIRAKRQLIALLNEQKQAIIHRAVTRGLNPDAPLKPSGVAWLGEIPEHWEVRKLKHLGEVKIGLTYSPSDVSEEAGKLVLRASNIRNGRIVSADNVYVTKVIPQSLLVTEGDILICVRSGSRNLVGKSALITQEMSGVTYGAFMSVLRSEINTFLYWVLNSNLLPSVMAEFETSTINQLTQSDLRDLIISVPPAAERNCIVDFLVSQTARIVSAIDFAQAEIALIREYRTRLIADVVTGKLDARAAAAGLAAEMGEEDAWLEGEAAGDDEEAQDEPLAPEPDAD